MRFRTSIVRIANFGLIGISLILSGFPTVALAKTLQVRVDARSGPWVNRSNAKLAFGTNGGKPPTLVWGANLIPGIKITFTATGSAAWITGGQRFGPNGDPSLIVDRSVMLMPYYYMRGSKPVGMIGLVGAFVSADGAVVGTPFTIGDNAKIQVPDGAAAISLGVNDDVFTDNDGGFQVSIDVPEPSVIVESDDKK